MKVLVVLGYIVPSQCIVWQQCRALGVDLHIVGTLERYSDLPRTVDTGPLVGVPTYPLVPRGGGYTDSSLYWTYPGLKSILLDLKPDIVHVVSEPHGFLVQQALSHATVVTVHASAVVQEHGNAIELLGRRWLARRSIRKLAGYAGANRLAVAAARVRGLSPATPTMIGQHLVPDPGPFLSARRPQLDETPELKVGFLGRLALEKGLDWLLLACARLPPGTFSLTLAGDGSEREAVGALAKTLGVDATFVGALAFENVPTYLASLDVLVLPSRTTTVVAEAFGRVVIEAMHCGTPVIVSSAGALPEVVGDAALVVEENDVAGLAAAIGTMRDPRTRAKYGRRGAEWAMQEHTPTSVAERLVTFWREVVTSTTQVGA